MLRTNVLQDRWQADERALRSPLYDAVRADLERRRRGEPLLVQRMMRDDINHNNQSQQQRVREMQKALLDGRRPFIIYSQLERHRGGLADALLRDPWHHYHKRRS